MRYKMILMKLWQKQYLDVTILQAVHNNRLIPERVPESFCKRNEPKFILHQFNPYSNVYALAFTVFFSEQATVLLMKMQRKA